MDAFSRPLRVFLCHSSGDKPAVRELYRRLDAEGWIDVWLDEEKLYPGQDWDYEIEKALDNSDAVIVTLSSGSVSKEGYVQRELRFVLDIALEKPGGMIYILPVRLDDCERPRRLRSIQDIDYFPAEQRERAYTRLRHSLELRARYLNLVTDEPKGSLSTTLASSVLPTPSIFEPAKTNQFASSKSLSSVAHPSTVTKRNTIWMYGRIAVLFLLITGFFGPWFSITSCGPTEGEPPPEPTLITGPEEYLELINSGNARVLIPFIIGVLFLLTLARLIPWRHRDNNVMIRLERWITGIAPITMFIEMYAVFFREGFGTTYLWGFWVSMAGTYLAPINVLCESIFTRQERQKLPRWAWVLLIITILPWLLLLLLSLWIKLS